MSEENVEVARRTLEALRRRDRTSWLALHDEDYEVVPARDFPESEVIRGPEAAFDFYLGTMDSFDQVPIDMTQIIDAGADKVLVHQQVDVRGRRSGADVPFDYWLVATFRQGKVLRTQWFADRDDALEAAGLQE